MGNQGFEPRACQLIIQFLSNFASLGMETWLPILTQHKQLAERAKKVKFLLTVSGRIHRCTHPTELVFISLPKIRTENTNLLMSPHLSLGVLPSSQPLGLNYNPNLYCQWLQSSIIQKHLLQKPRSQFPPVLQMINQPSQSTSPYN